MNQINYHQISEEEKRELELEFTSKKQYIAIPFVIVDGVDDITQGIYSSDPNRFKSSSLERVFQGRNPVILIWKDSTKSVPQTTEGGAVDYDKPSIAQFSVGYTMHGIIDEDGEVYFNSFEDDSRGNKRLRTSSTLTVKFQGNIPRDMWYDVYVFPELGEEYYYFESISVGRDADGIFEVTTVTLKKINDQLEMITTNESTLILRSSPGEEYAWPKIVDPADTSQLWPDVELDTLKQEAKPIKYLQLSSLEPMLLGSFYAWGRPASTIDGVKYIEEPRMLLPSKLHPSVVDPIQGINAPSERFFWLEQGQVTLGKEYKNWLNVFTEKLKGLFGSKDQDQLKNYGAIKIVDIDTAVQSSNDVTKVDGAGNTITVSQTYWDDWSIVGQADIAYDGKPGYKTYSPYSQERILNTDALAHDKLARNAFINQQIVQLPVEYESKVPFGIVNLTVGVLSKLILGQSSVLSSNNNTNRTSILDIPLMAEHSYIWAVSEGLMDPGTVGEANSKQYLPLQMFAGDRPEIVTGKNINTFNIKIELSELLAYNSKPNDTFSTVELGKEGKNYFSQEMSVKRDTKGYLLDRIIVQGISMGDIKITAFDEADNAVGSFMLNTNSKKTGSLLDWTTVIKTSEWENTETSPEDLTPDIPNPAWAGEDVITLPDRNITYTIDEDEYGSDEYIGVRDILIDLWSEFQEQDPSYTEPISVFLAGHTVSFDIKASIKETIIHSTIVNSRELLGSLEQYIKYGDDTTVVSLSTSQGKYDSINGLSGNIAKIEPFVLSTPEYDNTQNGDKNKIPHQTVVQSIHPYNIEIDSSGKLSFKIRSIWDGPYSIEWLLPTYHDVVLDLAEPIISKKEVYGGLMGLSDWYGAGPIYKERAWAFAGRYSTYVDFKITNIQIKRIK